jgi:hypothetical protein
MTHFLLKHADNSKSPDFYRTKHCKAITRAYTLIGIQVRYLDKDRYNVASVFIQLLQLNASNI